MSKTDSLNNKSNQNDQNDQNKDVVTPWKVQSGSKTGIDYYKLIDHFGCSPIDGKLIKRFEKVTGKTAHCWLRRGKFFSHKDLEKALDYYEAGKPVYLYTGRGPSSDALHMGHLVPFIFTKYLQDAFDAITIIQMSDDEKFHFKGGKLEDFNKLSYENAKDIIACGFNPDKTYIFSNLETVGGDLYKVVVRLMSSFTTNQFNKTYGFDSSNTIGHLSWPCFQMAPAFYQAFSHILKGDDYFCLVPMAIDQTPYFRGARDFVTHEKQKEGFIKPGEIHARFLPSLEGVGAKLSSTQETDQKDQQEKKESDSKTIFMTDSMKKIDKAIKTCFSGGGETREEQEKFGADLTVDVAYQWLSYFLEDDDELKKIAVAYSSGKMLSGQIKKILSTIVQNIVKTHQEKRQKVTDDVIRYFFNPTKKYDYSRKKIRDNIDDKANYDGYGINFDPYFGIYKSKE